MDRQAILAELLELAEKAGMEVRQEPLGGESGGLCRLRGKWVLFVDATAAPQEQLSRTAEALAEREEILEQYILPQVREELEKYRQGRK